jgi:uncharacterized protein (TIGR02145 family)
MNIITFNFGEKWENKLSFSIYLLIAVVLVLAGSCKKDDDSDNGIDAQTFTDSRDGNVYKTIKIGNQVWMAENLKYLPGVSKPGVVLSDGPLYFVYGYNGTDVSNVKTTLNYNHYGVLYNWEAAQDACPAGWHLPSLGEWKQLFKYLGGEHVAGGELKEAGTTHWRSTNTDVTNEFGFTALPGGFLDLDGTFKSTGYRGYWWSATPGDDSYSAWFVHVSYNAVGIGMNSFVDNKHGGISVRCVKN